MLLYRLAVLILLLSPIVTPGAAAAAALELAPCDGEAEALCGTLLVPENPQLPDGRSITLRVVVIPAVEPRAGAVPLFELAGGPGVAVTQARDFFLGAGRGYREHRDVVLIDQRGTGASSPLRCPELEALSPLEPMYPPAAVRRCRETLEAAADLTQYTTDHSAADLDRVRAALGYEQVDLQGISYGTELARAFMRLYPDRVRSAVLIGPPIHDMRTPLPHATNAQRTLDLMFHECQTDSSCAAAYPELRASWSSLLHGLQSPVRVQRVSPVTGERSAVEIRRGPLAEALRGLLGTAASRRTLPYLIHHAAAGDFDPLLDAFPPDSGIFAEGLYLSIACSESTSRISAEEVERATAGTFLGDYRVRQQMSACSVWPIAKVAPALFEPLRSEHPVLVVSGEMDHTTPPSYARAVCAALPRCRLVEVPGLGHAPFDLGSWSGGACLDQVIQTFFETATPEDLDTRCISRMHPPPFLLAAPAVEVAAERLALLSGRYSRGTLQIVIDTLAGRLRAQILSGGELVAASFLTPIAPDRFRLDLDPSRSLTFELDGDSALLRLTGEEDAPFIRTVE